MPKWAQICAPLLLGAVVLVAGVGPTEAQPHARPDDGSIEAFRHEAAAEAMAEGDYERARHLYQLILATRPNDALAQREAGRASHALGELDVAIEQLSRADALAGHAADAELCYLLGEALYVRGRSAEARAIHDRALRALGDAPTDRMERLWLARILARRGELARADAIYEQMTTEALARSEDDIEVAIARIEAHILARDWAGAEKQTRLFIAGHPRHERAHDILAWILEARGRLDEERALRANLADKTTPITFERTLAHGRALERSRQYKAALERYREAQAMDPDGDPALSSSIDRIAYRLSPEATVGAVFRSDPSGSSQELRTGVGVALSGEHSLSVTAAYDMAETDRLEATSGTATAALVLGRGRDLTSALMLSANFHSIAMTGMAGESADDLDIGSGAEIRAGTGRRLQLHARADLNMPWREAANTIREGGTYDGLTARVYALPVRDKLVIDAGARIRRMRLDPIAPMDDEDPRGSQTLLFGGVDWVAYANPGSQARGQILDEELLWPAYFADAIVLHYRHYEAFTDDDFGDRLVMADRDSIDEVGATARKAMSGGMVALELRGGAGYDWAREITMWRAGGALLFTPAERARFTFTVDRANESTAGFVGERTAAWMTFHVDL